MMEQRKDTSVETVKPQKINKKNKGSTIQDHPKNNKSLQPITEKSNKTNAELDKKKLIDIIDSCPYKFPNSSEIVGIDLSECIFDKAEKKNDEISFKTTADKIKNNVILQKKLYSSSISDVSNTDKALKSENFINNPSYDGKKNIDQKSNNQDLDERKNDLAVNNKTSQPSIMYTALGQQTNNSGHVIQHIRFINTEVIPQNNLKKKYSAIKKDNSFDELNNIVLTIPKNIDKNIIDRLFAKTYTELFKGKLAMAQNIQSIDEIEKEKKVQKKLRNVNEINKEFSNTENEDYINVAQSRTVQIEGIDEEIDTEDIEECSTQQKSEEGESLIKDNGVIDRNDDYIVDQKNKFILMKESDERLKNNRNKILDNEKQKELSNYQWYAPLNQKKYFPQTRLKETRISREQKYLSNDFDNYLHRKMSEENINLKMSKSSFTHVIQENELVGYPSKNVSTAFDFSSFKDIWWQEKLPKKPIKMQNFITQNSSITDNLGFVLTTLIHTFKYKRYVDTLEKCIKCVNENEIENEYIYSSTVYQRNLSFLEKNVERNRLFGLHFGGTYVAQIQYVSASAYFKDQSVYFSDLTNNDALLKSQTWLYNSVANSYIASKYLSQLKAMTVLKRNNFEMFIEAANNGQSSVFKSTYNMPYLFECIAEKNENLISTINPFPELVNFSDKMFNESARMALFLSLYDLAYYKLNSHRYREGLTKLLNDKKNCIHLTEAIGSNITFDDNISTSAERVNSYIVKSNTPRPQMKKLIYNEINQNKKVITKVHTKKKTWNWRIELAKTYLMKLLFVPDDFNKIRINEADEFNKIFNIIEKKSNLMKKANIIKYFPSTQKNHIYETDIEVINQEEEFSQKSDNSVVINETIEYLDQNMDKIVGVKDKKYLVENFNEERAKKMNILLKGNIDLMRALTLFYLIAEQPSLDIYKKERPEWEVKQKYNLEATQVSVQQYETELSNLKYEEMIKQEKFAELNQQILETIAEEKMVSNKLSEEQEMITKYKIQSEKIKKNNEQYISLFEQKKVEIEKNLKMIGVQTEKAQEILDSSNRSLITLKEQLNKENEIGEKLDNMWTSMNKYNQNISVIIDAIKEQRNYVKSIITDSANNFQKICIILDEMNKKKAKKIQKIVAKYTELRKVLAENIIDNALKTNKMINETYIELENAEKQYLKVKAFHEEIVEKEQQLKIENLAMEEEIKKIQDEINELTKKIEDIEKKEIEYLDKVNKNKIGMMISDDLNEPEQKKQNVAKDVSNIINLKTSTQSNTIYLSTPYNKQNEKYISQDISSVCDLDESKDKNSLNLSSHQFDDLVEEDDFFSSSSKTTSSKNSESKSLRDSGGKQNSVVSSSSNTINNFNAQFSSNFYVGGISTDTLNKSFSQNDLTNSNVEKNDVSHYQMSPYPATAPSTITSTPMQNVYNVHSNQKNLTMSLGRYPNQQMVNMGYGSHLTSPIMSPVRPTYGFNMIPAYNQPINYYDGRNVCMQQIYPSIPQPMYAIPSPQQNQTNILSTHQRRQHQTYQQQQRNSRSNYFNFNQQIQDNTNNNNK